MGLKLIGAGILLSVSLFGQSYGEITGVVQDASGAVISAAQVRVAHLTTGREYRTVSSDSGVYRVPFLPPGGYVVEASSPGFRTARAGRVEVQVDSPVRVDFSLEVGTQAESIEVMESVPLINGENANVGTVIENRRIVELPLNGRNWLQMVALAPNVSAEMRAGGHVDSRQGGERGRQPISVAGQRQFYNRFTLDGVENTDVNYNTYVIRPSIDALQEFKIQTGIYSAEFGRATAQVNATTKSGGNEFHGAVFHFLRNDKLDAKEWQVRGDKNPFRRNQFGFVFSGPLRRDRAFFLANYEGARDVRTLQGIANVAPSGWRRGDFSNQPVVIFDPQTRTYAVGAGGVERATGALPFPGNRIPAARLHPVALKLLEFYPEPSLGGENIVANYIRQRKRLMPADQFTQRLDFNESSRSSWFGRFSWADEFERRLENFSQQEGGVEVKVSQMMVANTRTLSPTAFNETRIGYNRFNSDLLLHFANRRDVTQELGIAGLVSPPKNAWGTPSISLGSGLASFGESGNGPWIYRNRTLQVLNNTSLVRGRHTLRFGGEMRRDRYNGEGNTVARGRFYFNGLLSINPAPGSPRAAAPNLFADLMLGLPQRSERALGVATGDLRATSWYGYFEDSWRVRPSVTLTAGLRYEFTPPWHEPNRKIINIQMFGWGPDARTPVMTRPGSGDFYDGFLFRFADVIPVQTGDDKMGRATIRPDRNDFAPRLSIAWAPGSNWSIRNGAGVFFTQDQGNPRFDMVRNIAGRGDFTASDQRPNSFLDDPWRNERQTFTCTGWTGQCVGQPFVLGNVNNRRTPYVIQWLVNVQRQLTPDLLLEFGYMGNIGRKLERLRGTNEPRLRTGPEDTSSVQSRRPFPVYGIIQQVDGVVNSNYNAFNAKLQHRFSRGFTLLAAYTFSKSIDDASGIRVSSGDQSIAKYDWNLRDERGLSQFHTAHRFVASWIYAWPAPRAAPRLVQATLGGWQLGGIVTRSTGNPVRVASIGDTNAIGGEGNYPDATGVSPFSNAGWADRFWNIAAFDASSPELRWRFGNVGRNTLIGPGYFQWDASLVRNFAMPFEDHSLQLRWEIFNTTNTANWNVPSSDVRNPATFGRVLSARNMREMQIALKYIF
jgi:hypothetical protein